MNEEKSPTLEKHYHFYTKMTNSISHILNVFLVVVFLYFHKLDVNNLSPDFIIHT